MVEPDAEGLRERLRAGLRDSMKQRDKPAMAAFRAALSVIDNAEAADSSEAPAVEAGHIAGGVTGLGASEVARAHRSDVELIAFLRDEVTRWESTARDYELLGRAEDAAGLDA